MEINRIHRRAYQYQVEDQEPPPKKKRSSNTPWACTYCEAAKNIVIIFKIYFRLRLHRIQDIVILWKEETAQNRN